MELATGRQGKPHITSQQDRQKHQGIFGDGAYILNTGNMLEPEVQSSNKIHIKDGALMFQGALFTIKVGTYDEVTINNGNQGMKRKDLIVARYTYNSSDNIETGEWAVIQGTPAADNPVVPDATSGDIQAGDNVVDCPVFVVNLDGINVTGIDIIPEVMDTIPDLISNLTLSSDELIEGVTITRCGRQRVLQIGNATSPTAGDIVRLPGGDIPPDYVMGSASYRGQTQGDYFISITPKSSPTPGKVGLFRGNNAATSVGGPYIVAHIDWYVSP